MSGLYTNQLARSVCDFTKLNLLKIKLRKKNQYFSDDATETRRPFGQPLCLVAEEPATVAPPPRKGVRKKK